MRDMSNLNLKGIWIPIEILTDKITQVSKLINSLKNKNYISIELIYKENSKQIEMRKLIPIVKNNDT